MLDMMNIKEQIIEALEPYTDRLNKMLEGYISLSINKGKVKILALHETHLVKLKN